MARVKQEGLTYRTGKACPNGHLAPRYTSNGTCVVCSRDRQRLALYGLTPAAFAALLEGQGGGCAICKETSPPQNRDTRDGWHVDHCHETGVVRGILCAKCNRGIGFFDDDPIKLARAAEYLR